MPEGVVTVLAGGVIPKMFVVPLIVFFCTPASAASADGVIRAESGVGAVAAVGADGAVGGPAAQARATTVQPIAAPKTMALIHSSLAVSVARTNRNANEESPRTPEKCLSRPPSSGTRELSRRVCLGNEAGSSARG
jgi:hypothetical protein